MYYKKSETEKTEKKDTHDSIFSKENVNMIHQPEFDYVKTLGVFLIAHVHIYDNFCHGYFQEFIDFIGFIVGAGGFMILMGLGMKYSRHHDPKSYMIRGFILLTLGQLVNLLRDCLPNLIAWWTTGNKIFLSRSMMLLQTDILSFAGLAFLVFAIMKQMYLSDNCILIISFFMNITSFFIYKIIKPPNNILSNIFLGYFILTKAESFFPLMSYFIFVSFGYWLGGVYQKLLNKDKFYYLILIFCFPIVVIYYYFRSHYNFPILPEYYSDEHFCLNAGPDAIICCMTNLTFLAFFYQIHKILNKKTPEFIIHAAKNFNQYYIISYTFTMQTNTFLRALKGDDYPSKLKYPFILAMMVLVLCRILIDLNDKYIHFEITTLKNQKRNIVYALIWISNIIIVIYIYPKIDIMATIWNHYLRNNGNINTKLE